MAPSGERLGPEARFSRTGPIVFLTLFILQTAFSGGLGLSTRGTSRGELMAAAFVQALGLVVGLGYLLRRAIAQGYPLRILQQDRMTAMLAIVWAILATLAAIVGALARHPVLFILGDYYKFMALIAFLAIATLAIASRAEAEYVLRGMVILFGVILLYDIGRYHLDLLQGNRFTSHAVNHIPVMAPIICYVVVQRHAWWLSTLFWAALGVTLLALSWAQTLSGYIGYLIALAILLTLARKYPLREGRLMLGTWLVAGSALAMVLFALALNVQGGMPIPGQVKPATSRVPTVTPRVPVPLPAIVPQSVATSFLPGPRLQYIRARVIMAARVDSVEHTLEVMSGSRPAEIAVIVQEVTRTPLRSAFGVGLGRPLPPLPTIGPAQHAGVLEWLDRRVAALFDSVMWAAQQLPAWVSAGYYRIGNMIFTAIASSAATIPNLDIFALLSDLIQTLVPGDAAELSPNHPKHYIHAGLFEALYRTGFAGLGTLLALLGVLLVRGYRLLSRWGHPLGLFVVVSTLTHLLLLAYSSYLMLTYTFIALSFAVVRTVERECHVAELVRRA